MREASDLVYNVINCSKPIVSAIHGPAVGAGLVVAMLADISVAGRKAKIIDGHTRLGVAAGRPRGDLLAAACRHGESQVLPADLRAADRRGGRTDRHGLALRGRRRGAKRALEIAESLAAGAQTAIRWTKNSLNNWYRQAGPIFDASLGLEFFGFAGPEVREGLASHQEKRTPKFG